MSYRKLIKNRIDDTLFKKICDQSKSMTDAAVKLNLHFNSFKKRALELGCYNPNPSGKGIQKISPKIPIRDIVERGLHPYYQSFKLKKRLIAENMKIAVCENCGCESWCGKPISIELHHIDGNRHNHLLRNLKFLCPNCHSQTNTYRSKNKKI